MTQRLSRDDLVRMAQHPDPWTYLAVFGQVLQAAPEDHALRFLGAACLARLSLPTLARDQLDLLPTDASQNPDVAKLRDAIGALPENRLAPEQRIETCQRNLAALADRLEIPRDVIETWEPRVRTEECYITRDANVIRRPAGSNDPTEWIGVANHRALAAKLIEQLIASSDNATPISIEGVDPPWLLERAAAYLTRDPTGSHARLAIVQGDAQELLDGLSLADLPLLHDERVIAFAGPDAGTRYADWLSERRDTAPVGVACVTPGVRTRTEPGVEQVLARAGRDQQERTEQLTRVVGGQTAGRDSAYWAARYEEAQSGAEPLRVLIPTCRFSTYIRHASRDLARAFESIGCAARILIEPDDSSRLTKPGYLAEFGEFDPDLVLLINYPRATMGDVMPRNVPYVCWIQDAMPHLFEPQVGASQTELDFVAGHLHGELFDKYGYPRDRAISAPVTASAATFHDGPVTDAQRDRFACEISVVTNHSETPNAMRDRLITEAGPDPKLRGAMTRIADDVRRIVDSIPHEPTLHVRRRVLDTVEDVTEPGELRERLFRHFAYPLADRTFRHNGIASAARIAERRGWRLKLFGNGWESHSEFGRYAAGPVEHGDDLRACYRSSSITLHLSLNWLLHQRVFEAALSAGLPACGRVLGNFDPFQHMRTRIEAGPPDREEAGRVGFLLQDDGVARTRAAGQKIGAPWVSEISDGLLWIDREQYGRGLGRLARTPAASGDALGALEPALYMSEPELESISARAIEDPAWRSEVSTSIANVARSSFSTEAFARSLVAFVASSLQRSAVQAAA